MLTLLCHAQARTKHCDRRGTGTHDTSLTRWTDEEARVFTMDLVQWRRAGAGAAEQQVEVPTLGEWGRFANHFAIKAFSSRPT